MIHSCKHRVGFMLDQHCTVWMCTCGTRLEAQQKGHTHMSLITHGVIISTWNGSREAVFLQFCVIRPCMLCLISMQLSIVYISLYSLHKCIYVSITVYTCVPSFSLLRISRFFHSQLLMKCPLRIPMCCSLLGNGENREAAVWLSFSFCFFPFLFVTLAPLTN